MTKYSRNTTRAIRLYGIEACLEALRLNRKIGEGASSIAMGYSLHPRLNNFHAVNAAINAGEEISSFRILAQN